MKTAKHPKPKLRAINPLSVLRIFLMVLLIGSLFVFVFLDSFAGNAFSLPFYKDQFKKNEVYAVFGNEGYTHQAVDDIGINVMKFLKGKENLTDFFNANEISHMKDVQKIFHEGYAVFFISIAAFLVLLVPFYMISRKQRTLSTDFSIITITTGGLLIASLFIFVFVNFNTLFIRFHEIFFTGNWIFPSDSHLIQMFPKQFFISITKRIGLHTLFKALVLIAVGLIPIFLKLTEKKIIMEGFNSAKVDVGKCNKK